MTLYFIGTEHAHIDIIACYTSLRYSNRYGNELEPHQHMTALAVIPSPRHGDTRHVDRFAS